jgi:hypothetical protein
MKSNGTRLFLFCLLLTVALIDYLLLQEDLSSEATPSGSAVISPVQQVFISATNK